MVLLRTQSDERLVALARAGNERAFEAIVARYRPLLLRAARRYLGDARAEDAVQQAFLAAWSALQRGDDVRDLRPWLYRIVHNTALNALRATGHDWAELPDTVPGEGSELDRRMDVREALTGLAALPERQREALLRVAVEGRPQTEVAAELGVSEGAVRQLVHRARLTLRAAATAVTPLPLVTWLAGTSAAGAAAGAGAAGTGAAGAGAATTVAATGGGGAFVAKVGTVAVIATTAIAVPVVVRDEPPPPATAEAARPSPTRRPGHVGTPTPRVLPPVATRTPTATAEPRRSARRRATPAPTARPRATSTATPRAAAPTSTPRPPATRAQPTATPRREPTATPTPRREPTATATAVATPAETPHTYDEPRTDNSGPGSTSSGSGSSGSGTDNSGPGSDSSGSGSSGSDNSGPGSGSSGSGSGSSGHGGHGDDS